MGLPCAPAPLQLTGEAALASAQLPPITAGLASFMVVPKSLGGTLMIKGRGQLFNHMARLARRTTAEAVDLVPSAFLDVAMGKGQARVALNPTPQDYTMGAIMRSAGGTGATIDLAKRKLDAMGGIRGQSCLLNNEERLQQMRMQLDLAMSLSVVKQAEAQAKRAKKEAAV